MATGGKKEGIEELFGANVCGSTDEQTNSDQISKDNSRQSDAVHEYTCSPCSYNEVTKEATHYCPECDVCYCKACLCDHAVLGRSKVEQWGRAVPDEEQSEEEEEEETEVTCLRHAGHTITMFCVDHDAVCCQLCIATYHRKCRDTEELSDAANRRSVDKSTILQTEADIASLERAAESHGKEIGIKHAAVETSYTDYVRRMCETERKVVHKFEEMRKQALIGKQQILDYFNANKLVCKNIAEELTISKKTLRSTKSDKQTFFIHIKRARELVEEKRRVMKNIITADDVPVFEHMSDTNEAYFLTIITHNLSVKMTEMRISVATEKDNKECHIVGICQIDNGNLVLADRGNKCLKLLGKDYAVINQYTLKETLNGVCAIGDSEVAVIMNNSHVLIVAIGASFNEVRSFNIDFRCEKVAGHNGHLYFAFACKCNTKIQVFDSFGKAIKRFTKSVEGASCSCRASNCSVAINDDGNKIFVAKPDGDIIAMDAEGRTIATTNIYRFQDGLCCDDQGYLYALAFPDVKQLFQEGRNEFEEIKTIGTPSLRGTQLKTMCYDKKLCLLVMCPANGGYLYLAKRN